MGTTYKTQKPAVRHSRGNPLWADDDDPDGWEEEDLSPAMVAVTSTVICLGLLATAWLVANTFFIHR